MATIELFDRVSHAALYSKYRPTYSKSILDIIANYMTRKCVDRQLAVDVACGNGQSTFYLCDFFQQCIGVDISKAQIDQAQEKCKSDDRKGIQFMVGNGMELPVETSSADAVTVAQAWHWMVPSLSTFYSEAKRILKPNGCLAVYGYGNIQIANSKCNSLIRNFYSNTLKGYWHEQRRHIDNEYAEVNLPFSSVERHNIDMIKSLSVLELIGYVSSWSGYINYCDKNPDNNVLQELQTNLLELSTADKDSDMHLEVNFPVFIIIGQNN